MAQGDEHAHHETGDPRGRAGALVKAVREATERYKDVAVAEADKYALAFGCVSGPDYGAMGLHYVNFPLVLDGELDVDEAGDRHLRAAAERQAEADRRGLPRVRRRRGTRNTPRRRSSVDSSCT